MCTGEESGEMSSEKLSDQTSNLQTTATESILANAATRNEFTNDLFELECFLVQRLTELSSDSQLTSNIITLSSGAYILGLSDSADIQQCLKIVQQNNTPHNITKMLTHVRSIIDILEGKKLKTLIEIKHSKRFVDRLAESILSKLDIARKFEIAKLEVQHKREGLNQNVKELFLRLKKIKQQTLFLREKIENSLSAIFDGRPVNVVVDTSKL